MMGTRVEQLESARKSALQLIASMKRLVADLETKRALTKRKEK